MKTKSIGTYTEKNTNHCRRGRRRREGDGEEEQERAEKQISGGLYRGRHRQGDVT